MLMCELLIHIQYATLIIISKFIKKKKNKLKSNVYFIKYFNLLFITDVEIEFQGPGSLSRHNRYLVITSIL